MEFERVRTPLSTLLSDATISPKWTEPAITAAIISAGFGLAAQYLPIFAAEEQLTFKQPEAAVGAAVLSHAGN